MQVRLYSEIGLFLQLCNFFAFQLILCEKHTCDKALDLLICIDYDLMKFLLQIQQIPFRVYWGSKCLYFRILVT